VKALSILLKPNNKSSLYNDSSTWPNPSLTSCRFSINTRFVYVHLICQHRKYSTQGKTVPYVNAIFKQITSREMGKVLVLNLQKINYRQILRQGTQL